MFDEFGQAVAFSGDTVVIGAYLEDSSSTGVNSTPDDIGGLNANTGAVYVFVLSNNTWTQQAYLKPSDTGVNVQFGISVGISGDTIVVGSNSAAYVFERSGTTWSQQALLQSTNIEPNDSFGTAVAVSGNTVVVGAKFEDSGTSGVNTPPDETAFSAGAAYVVPERKLLSA